MAESQGFRRKSNLSNEKRAPGCLLGIYGMTNYAVIWGLFQKPLYIYIRIPSLNNQDFMESSAVFFFRGSCVFPNL